MSLSTPRLSTTLAGASTAEAAGAQNVWLTEYPDRDALVRSMAVGMRTHSVGVATGIAYAFTRHPLSLAAGALDVHEATGGRFGLGLGTGTGGMRARWYGMPSDRPATYLRETAELLRAAWESDGTLDYDGTFHHAHVRALGFAERARSLDPLLIFGSGLGEAMLRVSARHLDGVLLHPLAVGEQYAKNVLEPALAAGTRSRTVPPRLIQWLLVAVDDDGSTARGAALASLAFYLATPSYARHFADTPWADAQSLVATEFRAGNHDFASLARLIPAGMADDYTVWGSEADVAEKLVVTESRLSSRGVDELVLQAATLGVTEESQEVALTTSLARLI